MISINVYRAGSERRRVAYWGSRRVPLVIGVRVVARPERYLSQRLLRHSCLCGGVVDRGGASTVVQAEPCSTS